MLNCLLGIILVLVAFLLSTLNIPLFPVVAAIGVLNLIVIVASVFVNRWARKKHKRYLAMKRMILNM